MPSALPDGDPVPADGSLPRRARRRPGRAPVRVLRARAVLRGPLRLLRLQHLHRRPSCGGGGARRASYADAAVAEIALAREVLGDATCRSSTVFFGGGTPTLLPPADLARIAAPRSATSSGWRPAPRSPPRPTRSPSTAAYLAALRDGRLHPDLASACSRPCRTCCAMLDRTHDPAGCPQACGWARAGRLRAASAST